MQVDGVSTLSAEHAVVCKLQMPVQRVMGFNDSTASGQSRTSAFLSSLRKTDKATQFTVGRADTRAV